MTTTTKPDEISTSGGNFLNPSTTSNTDTKRVRIASLENDDGFVDNESGEFGNSADFTSSYQELNKFSHYRSKRELIVSYLKISVEGDLAGFQIAWLMMSLGFLILKIFNITDIIKTIKWWAIFVIPIFNALLTARFDYIIRKYRSTRTIESLAKSRFLVLWAIKVVFVIYVTTYWIWGRGSFMVRAKQLHSFQENHKACTGQIICVYIGVLAASFMSEMMITTVLINSEQNLSMT
eukprot:306579_1